MKPNEAPEKLYIDSREHWMKSWTAFTTKAKGDDIEYVRADAFIEKVTEYLQEHLIDYWSQGVTDESKFINEFIEYIKGE